MTLFVAHYRSANSAESRALGSFDFESEARLGSKANMHDARVKMLELYGNEALSWLIDSVNKKRSEKARDASDGQLELDFREPTNKPIKKRRQSTKRGVL